MKSYPIYKENTDMFLQNIRNHVNNPRTQLIAGTYRTTIKVVHFYNDDTRINVMKNMDGSYRSGWQMADVQVDNLRKHGNVQ